MSMNLTASENQPNNQPNNQLAGQLMSHQEERGSYYPAAPTYDGSYQDDAYDDYCEPAPAAPLGMDYHTLMKAEVPMLPCALDPIIPESGLCMLYAERGIGKTMLALSVALAVARGGPCLRWKAPFARPVIYVDGEMPMDAMQQRLRMLAATQGEPREGHLRLISRQMLLGHLPDLSTSEGQYRVNANVPDHSLLVLDNLSTLFPDLVENDSESWTQVQNWLLELRSRHVAVLMVHHAGKSGDQRGTSRREDVLDTVISLVRPPGYRPSQGARFEVHLKKARSVFGAAADPFTVCLQIEQGCARWEIEPASSQERSSSGYKAGPAGADDERDLLDEIQQQRGAGQSIRTIADNMGLSKSRVSRLLQR